jgi:nucleoid DNA-binding protein
MEKTMAKKSAAPMKKMPKLTAAAKPRKKSELFQMLAEHNDLSRKQVAGVFETLGKIMAVDLAKPGDGKPKEFVVPGMMKVKSIFKPATKAAQKPNPFKPGEMMTVKAKPAKTVIKIRPLKALKDMV